MREFCMFHLIATIGRTRKIATIRVKIRPKQIARCLFCASLSQHWREVRLSDCCKLSSYVIEIGGQKTTGCREIQGSIAIDKSPANERTVPPGRLLCYVFGHGLCRVRRHWRESACGAMVRIWSVPVFCLIVQLAEFRELAGNTHWSCTFSFCTKQLVIAFVSARFVRVTGHQMTNGIQRARTCVM